MKFNRFINQTIITTSCRPTWDVVALNIGIPTLRAFLFPRILDFNFVVVRAFQLHLGNILSDFLRAVKKNCSGFHFLFSRSRPRFPSRITNRPMLGILRLALSWLAVSQSVSLLTVKRLADFSRLSKIFFDFFPVRIGG
jgi:hypothetical protein